MEMGIRLDPETHQLGTNPRGLRSGIWGQGWGEGGGTGPLRSPTSRLHRLQGPREGQGGAGDAERQTSLLQKQRSDLLNTEVSFHTQDDK